MEQIKSFLDVDRARLSICQWPCEEGSDKWVLLNNGHTRPTSDFKMMARYLNQGGISCLAFDPRGSGESHFEGGFTLEDMVSDCWKVIESLGIRPFGVLGVSMGGMISQQLLLQKPQYLERAVLISTTNKMSPPKSGQKPWGKDLGSVTLKLSDYFSDSYFQNNQMLVKAMAKQILTKIEAGSFSGSAKAQHQAIDEFDVKDQLGDVQAKTLIIHGDMDKILPIDGAKLMHKSIPDSRLSIHENKGHLLIAESGKRLYREALDFFIQR